MSEPSAVYLVTGTNRGIGLGFVNQILSKHENAFVYAGVRNPAIGTTTFDDIQKRYPGRLAVVKLVSGDVEGNKAVADEIEAKHGRVDTVIANAAISNVIAPVSDISPTGVNEHFQVNVIGPIVLFQAVYSLLKRSGNPRFILISSSGGRLSGESVTRRDFGNVAYGSSKAALNWVARKIHFENEWLSALSH